MSSLFWEKPMCHCHAKNFRSVRERPVRICSVPMHQVAGETTKNMIIFFAKKLYYIPWLLKRIHLYRSKVCTSQAEDSDPSPQLPIHLPARTGMTCKQQKLLSAAPPHHALLLKFLEKIIETPGASWTQISEYHSGGLRIMIGQRTTVRWFKSRATRFSTTLLVVVVRADLGFSESEFFSQLSHRLSFLSLRDPQHNVYMYISAWRQARFVSSAFWQ